MVRLKLENPGGHFSFPQKLHESGGSNAFFHSAAKHFQAARMRHRAFVQGASHPLLQRSLASQNTDFPGTELHHPHQVHQLREENSRLLSQLQSMQNSYQELLRSSHSHSHNLPPANTERRIQIQPMAAAAEAAASPESSRR